MLFFPCRLGACAVIWAIASLSGKAIAQQDTSHTADTTVPAHNISHSQHKIQPSLELTLSSSSSQDQDQLSAIWIAGLDASYFYNGEPWQFGATLFSRYGQTNTDTGRPVKSQDDLIISITPSRTIFRGPQIRLFLETTAQTQFAKGTVNDTVPTTFLDPLFVYQSLFLGRRFSAQAEDGTWQYDLTAGIGYALQETVAQNFILQRNRNIKITQQNPLSSVQNEVTLESGYSAIVNFNLQESIGDNFQFTTSWKTVAINRIDAPSLPAANTFLQNARVTSLLLIGFQYKFLSLDYTGDLTYDRNVSLERTLDQSLVFGFKATF